MENYLKKMLGNGPPNNPEKNLPVKPDKNPDTTKKHPNEPEKNDPTRIVEPNKTDPTRIEPTPDKPKP